MGELTGRVELEALAYKWVGFATVRVKYLKLMKEKAERNCKLFWELGLLVTIAEKSHELRCLAL